MSVHGAASPRTLAETSLDAAAPCAPPPDEPVLLIENVRLVDASRSDPRGWVSAAPAGVVAVGTGAPPPVPTGCKRVDGGGRMLTPGLIDMHSHGCGGGAFDRGSDEIARALRATGRHGVTRSMLSLVTAPPEDLCAQLTSIAGLAREDGGSGPHAPERPQEETASGAAILGIHLEGPFLSPANAGAHEPSLMRAPEAALVDEFAECSQGLLTYMTIAPELPGALEVIAHLARRGIRAGVGHTTADYALTRDAFDAGARVLTHAFNAMPGIHHRAPGPVAAALDDDRATVELILDGVHVLEPVARLLSHAAGDRLALITDAMSAAGGPDGDYRLGDLDVRVVDGMARVRGSDTIAGSTLTLDAAVRRAVRAGIDLRAAVAAATAAPARGLGVGDRYGRLVPGYAADLVLWDDDLEVRTVWRDARELGADGS